MLNSKRAFTFAEILATLLIIGVIASMTIPALCRMMPTKEHTQPARKKAFSTFSNALSLSEQMNGPSRKWSMIDNNTAKDFDEYWRPYLNVIKLAQILQDVLAAVNIFNITKK